MSETHDGHAVMLDLMLAALLDRIGDQDLAILLDHLSGCSSCRASNVEIQRLWFELGEVPPELGEVLPGLDETYTLDGRTPGGKAASRPVRELGAEPTTSPADSAPKAVGARRREWLRHAILAASLVIGGVWLGRITAPSAMETVSEDHGARFLLVVRTPPDSSRRELATWTGQLQQEDRLVDAATVTTSERFGSAGSDSLPINAYMIVQARDLDAARDIVRTSPVVGAGGSVELAAVRVRD